MLLAIFLKAKNFPVSIEFQKLVMFQFYGGLIFGEAI